MFAPMESAARTICIPLDQRSSGIPPVDLGPQLVGKSRQAEDLEFLEWLRSHSEVRPGQPTLAPGRYQSLVTSHQSLTKGAA
jgi:hypothetical protein